MIEAKMVMVIGNDRHYLAETSEEGVVAVR